MSGKNPLLKNQKFPKEINDPAINFEIFKPYYYTTIYNIYVSDRLRRITLYTVKAKSNSKKIFKQNFKLKVE